MAEESWDEPATGQAAHDQTQAIAAPEMPDIKLFGRWSCGDVAIKDMSLEVSPHFRVLVFFVTIYDEPFTMYSLYRIISR